MFISLYEGKKMANDTKIAFLDLVTPHVELEEELVASFRSALRSAAFIGGPAVESFEQDFATFCDTRFCVGVGSGTDALRFALAAAGIAKGDCVITVPNTFIATTEAISQAGAHPDFVDVDARTYTMDPERLRAYLETQCVRDPQTGRTTSKRTGKPLTAVVPVHLYGQMADMDPILDLAAKYSLIVVEDACQAPGISPRTIGAGTSPARWAAPPRSVSIPARTWEHAVKRAPLRPTIRRS
jgi:dTDP-4-amino-4,6-dideoxygalactose transaminase